MNNIKKNKGFSLIELLLAITILSVVMIMVTQFMGTSSIALTRTKKNLNIQTEAMEVGNKLSDIMMQATYIRVRTKDHLTYELDMSLDGERAKRDFAPFAGTTVSEDLVVDNYPNYINPASPLETSNRQIILNTTNFRLQNADGAFYPVGGDLGGTAIVQSFRLLSSNQEASGDYVNPLYVNPEFIYIQYVRRENGVSENSYVMLFFDDNNRVFMDRNTMDQLVQDNGGVAVGDGFEVARTRQQNKMGDTNGQNGLLSEHVADCYFSADSETNTVYLNMTFEDDRFEQYTYNYAETLILRNSNVLTVEPQNMFRSN